MLIHFGIDTLQAEWPKSVVCIGTFDGVHLGHQELIKKTVSIAQQQEIPSIVLTFNRNPLEILAPDKAPEKLLPFGESIRIIQGLGASVYVVLDFDCGLATMTAQRFFDFILKDKLKASELVIGHDFAMGKNRLGDTQWLKERILTRIVPPFEIEGKRVSSTIIRNLIIEGKMEEAERFLGRPYSLTGVVVSGQKLGYALGYPTINIARGESFLLPPDGVYAGRCSTVHGTYDAAIAIGIRPTIGGTHRTIEAYLLKYPGTSLYGSSVDLELTNRIREERCFDSLDSLKEQIGRDVALIANILANRVR